LRRQLGGTLLALVFGVFMDPANLKQELKRLIIQELDLRGRTEADIVDDAPLFGDGLGLDSLDALQLAMAIEERFGVRIPEGEEARQIFASVSALAEHIARVGA
jgi:acyl carrier protein